MPSCNFSLHDVRFRRRADDECDIVVHGQTVGTVTRRPDIGSNDPDSVYFVVHLFDDWRGPRQLDDRHDIRRTAAEMIANRDLVPSRPPPVHSSYRDRLPT